MRILTRIFALALTSTATVLPAAAGSLDDPFATAARTPAAPSPQQFGRSGAVPCTDRLPDTPLGPGEAVDLALCRHPQTREVWATARAQAAQLGVARAAWLPTVDASLAATRYQYAEDPYTRRSASLTLSWLLYDFGQRAAGVEAAEQLLAAASATQDATVQSLFLAALQAYYNAQATRAAVGAAGQAERSAEAALAAAELRYKVGVGTPADRLQAQTARSQATLNRIRAEGEAQKALGVLANAIGLPAGRPLALQDAPPPPAPGAFAQDVAALIAEAQARRPDLKAAEAQLRAAEAAVDAARAAGLPRLSLAAGPSWVDTGPTTTQGGQFGLTLSVPLFSGFDTTYRVRSASAQADVRAAQRDRVQNQVALDVWQAWQNLNTATQSLQTTADLVASAEQSERVALGRYKAGVGSVLDLLSAQSALAAARVQRIQAELDWNVNRAALAQSVGALDYSLLQGAAEGRP